MSKDLDKEGFETIYASDPGILRNSTCAPSLHHDGTPAADIPISKWDRNNLVIGKTGAARYSKGKERYDLVPFEAIDGIREVLEHGLEKYGKDNWKNGFEFMHLYGSISRHLYKFFFKHEDIDSDSGIHHAKLLLTNIAFLVYFIEKGRKDLDDRE